MSLAFQLMLCNLTKLQAVSGFFRRTIEVSNLMP